MHYLLVLLLSVLSFTAIAADNSYPTYDRVMAKNEIVCGVYVWPPYVNLDLKTKKFSGLSIELIEKMFATIDLKVKFQEVIVGTQVQDVNNGRVDAVCTDGPWTMSAAKFVEFSNPYGFNPVYPYVRADDNRFKTRADLNYKDVKFTGIDGDLSTDLVRRLFPKATLLGMPNTTDVSQLYMNVETKKADVAIVDPASFEKYTAKNPDKLKALFLGSPLGVYKSVISVKKGDIKMLGLVNEAIDNALHFGVLDEIMDKYDPKHEKFKRVRSKFE
jgi:ABC-type amino acid transport substrate-binding protein